MQSRLLLQAPRLHLGCFVKLGREGLRSALARSTSLSVAQQQRSVSGGGDAVPVSAASSSLLSLNTTAGDDAAKSQEERKERGKLKAIRAFTRTVPIDHPMPKPLMLLLDKMLAEANFKTTGSDGVLLLVCVVQPQSRLCCWCAEIKRTNYPSWHLANRFPIQYSIVRRVLLEVCFGFTISQWCAASAVTFRCRFASVCLRWKQLRFSILELRAAPLPGDRLLFNHAISLACLGR
jgi:hypothetical protein